MKLTTDRSRKISVKRTNSPALDTPYKRRL
jgi:hypothetical protein